MWVKLDKIGKKPKHSDEVRPGHSATWGWDSWSRLSDLKFADDQALVPLLTLGVLVHAPHHRRIVFVPHWPVHGDQAFSQKHGRHCHGRMVSQLRYSQLRWWHHCFIDRGPRGFRGNVNGCGRPREIHRCILHDRFGIGRVCCPHYAVQ